MNLKLHKKFEKDFNRINDKKTKIRILNFIKELKSINHFSELKKIEKISGFNFYYKYRVGNYRLGVFLGW